MIDAATEGDKRKDTEGLSIYVMSSRFYLTSSTPVFPLLYFIAVTNTRYSTVLM